MPRLFDKIRGRVIVCLRQKERERDTEKRVRGGERKKYLPEGGYRKQAYRCSVQAMSP